MYTYIYIYIYRERDIEREMYMGLLLCLYLCIMCLCYVLLNCLPGASRRACATGSSAGRGSSSRAFRVSIYLSYEELTRLAETWMAQIC